MKAVVLTIGDELLIGQVINTNAAWLGQKLSALGAHVVGQLTVGDQEAAIVTALDIALKAADVVVVSGGLGPTLDDITMQAIGRCLNVKLVRNKEWLAKIEEYFKSKGRDMPPGNEKMADIPDGSKLLDNDCGTACGCIIDSKVFVLPGVPYEMASMFQRHVEPVLKIRSDQIPTTIITLQTTGIGESALAAKFTELNKYLKDGVSLAFLPSPRGVRLRITARVKGDDLAKEKATDLKNYLIEQSGKYYFGEGELGLEDALGEILKKQNKTLSVAESCTGGYVLSRLTDVPGSSSYVRGGVVAYDNSVKINELGVSPALLDQKGAVSSEVAAALAEGALKKFGTDLALGITGIAGPSGGTEEKPVGLVYIALAAKGKTTEVHRHLFEKDRLRNKERASQAALDLVRHFFSP